MIIGTFRDHSLTSKDKATQSGAETESEDDDIVVLDSKGTKEEKLIGWAYVGSHNFTPSAWGTLSGSSFNPSLNVSPFVQHEFIVLHLVSTQITNFELGVLLPLRRKEDLDSVVCWEQPAKKYVIGTDEPWVSSMPYLSFKTLDMYPTRRCSPSRPFSLKIDHKYYIPSVFCTLRPI